MHESTPDLTVNGDLSPDVKGQHAGTQIFSSIMDKYPLTDAWSPKNEKACARTER